jgi:hypothetical protein
MGMRRTYSNPDPHGVRETDGIMRRKEKED